MNDSELRAVIAEDEAVLRDEPRARVAALWPELEICALVADGQAALAALELHRPQVLFLDIQMPGLSGMEVARRASGRCHVIFVTAHDEFGRAAFEQGAVDYVMKLFATERLTLAIERMKARLSLKPRGSRGPARDIRATARSSPRVSAVDQRVAGQRPALHHRGRGLLLSSVAVTHLCCHAGTGVPDIRRSVRELSAELDPDRFRQIHRSIIVNLGEIAGIQRDFRGRMQVKLKRRTESLPVSDPYAPLFRQM